jgi:transposase
MRYQLSDYEWTAIKPLPNKPRGIRRVNDRRVLNGIFWVLRSGAPWRDLPAVYGPRTTCYNRFVRSDACPRRPSPPDTSLARHWEVKPSMTLA